MATYSCFTCDGTGKVPRFFFFPFWFVKPCKSCHGIGSRTIEESHDRLENELELAHQRASHIKLGYVNRSPVTAEPARRTANDEDDGISTADVVIAAAAISMLSHDNADERPSSPVFTGGGGEMGGGGASGSWSEPERETASESSAPDTSSDSGSSDSSSDDS